MTKREIEMLLIKMVILAALIFFLLVAVFGCAHQELADVANQGNFHLNKIEDWGQSTVEIMANTAIAMDTLDEEVAAALSLEDPEAKRLKIRTIEEKINSIGEALYSIDISIPVIEGRKAGQCFDAIIDFTGCQPGHADDNTLALYIFRLKEAQLRLEKFKTAITKVTATIGAAIPGGSWLDHIWKIALGIATSYTGFRGVQHKICAGRAEKHNRFMVKAVNDLDANGGKQAYEAMKTELKKIPEGEKASFTAMVARQLARIKQKGGIA